jgi:hypothetical protein
VAGEAPRNIHGTFAQVTLNLEVVVSTPIPPTLYCLVLRIKGPRMKGRAWASNHKRHR